MPTTEVLVYREASGEMPFTDWLAQLARRNRRAAVKCASLVRLLRDFGYELTRPRAATLRDGVYELRTKVGNVNYRILYGYVGQNVALLSHGITKEGEVPDKEIDLAAARLKAFVADPTTHTATLEEM